MSRRRFESLARTSRPMLYQWILFDADGTLFDYDRAEAEALAETWRQAGLEPAAEVFAAYRRINGNLWREFERGEISQQHLRATRFSRLLHELELDADPAAVSAAYLRNLSRCSQLLDGAAELLAFLHGRLGLVLLTNGIPDVQRPRIEGSGIAQLFAAVVISGEVGAAKPSREIFDEAFRRMGDPAREEVLIVGDSLSSDIRGGAGYGIDTCWFNPQQRPREEGCEISYEIQRLDELPPILGLR
ncbi:MAG: YjjG family noncanonical pyrimidine nucleotidase [Thermoanaerobaculia bacterium]